ncbi:SulP family inorganic anion transporter [Halogeometricum luteum]|uniref:SulP family inorganic anion transporter n=1 Tax=Halogeometricum luteum TaxID=2950537 RepID=A0ABU2G539_9EURY|nr:SulP family inorganic anion transporter [Halogeometricum sp. S3BR5-2]MDS0295268.1 SulP family inorganic anion transporter [Halogeometricum sp. S3BR5-2]
MATDGRSERLKRVAESSLPIVRWLPAYDRSWLRPDVLAGITVAAAVIPEGLAYASLAGLPPQTGLYAALLGTVTYVLFASSRQVIMGPTSALAILLLAGVGPIADGSGAPYASLVVVTTVLVGLFCVAARALRLGHLVHFISGSVLTGFSTGAALYIVSTQLGKLFGISGASGTFFDRLWFVLSHLNEAQPATVVVGLVSVALLLVGRRFFPRVPTTLLVVVLAIAASSALDLRALGVEIVGRLPSGLPPLAVPSVPEAGVVVSLVPVAFALFILSYVQGIGAVQTFARRNGYRADPEQELLAEGMGNLAAGLFGGFVVGGSMSRSALNDSMGGKSQVVGAVVAVVLVVVLLFLTGLFTTLPEATLGAVVTVAVLGLVDVSKMQRLGSVSRSEFLIASASLFGVLALGMVWGVFIGVGLSLLHTIALVSDPKTEVLGRLRGSDHFVSRETYSDAVEIPDVLAYRVNAELFYANTNVVRDDLEARLRERGSPVALVVFDLSSSPIVDLAAAEFLGELEADLRSRGIDLRIAGANQEVAKILQATDEEGTLGEIREEEAIASVIDRWRRAQNGP